MNYVSPGFSEQPREPKRERVIIATLQSHLMYRDLRPLDATCELTCLLEAADGRLEAVRIQAIYHIDNPVFQSARTQTQHHVLYVNRSAHVR